jgi:hypothetical protein
MYRRFSGWAIVLSSEPAMAEDPRIKGFEDQRGRGVKGYRGIGK